MDPHIPEPGISPELEPDGWDLVDRVGAWDSFLCEFQVLQFVPWRHRETWALAWAEVLRRIQVAEEKLWRGGSSGSPSYPRPSCMRAPERRRSWQRQHGQEV